MLAEKKFPSVAIGQGPSDEQRLGCDRIEWVQVVFLEAGGEVEGDVLGRRVIRLGRSWWVMGLLDRAV